MKITKKDVLLCPACGGSLRSLRRQSIRCSKCKKNFKIENGIPLLFWPNEWRSNEDITQKVKEFYEKIPFPNYENIDSIWTLRQKAKNGLFIHLLDKLIPLNAKILEAGCGTGQVSNLLGSVGNRQVFATDICLNSLKLGNVFKKKAKIKNTFFSQMNLFRPIFKPETFDYVLCNGVLHHTNNPYLGFQTLTKLVKPGGFIIPN